MPAGADMMSWLRDARLHQEGLSAAGLALLLCLFMATVAGASRGLGGEVAVQLRPLADAEGRPSQISADGHALLLPGGRGRTGSARLRFSLPDDGGGQSRWVVWIGRMPVDALVVQRDGWRSVQRDFFAPGEDEGVLPSGFQFPLPASFHGDVELDLHASATMRAALRVKVLRESEAMRVEQRGAALAAAIYAALFTLALLTLALFGAARDRIFLLFFGATTAALLLLSAENGHLYQLPVFGLLSSWRGQGIWALGLIYLAATLQLLRRYADTAKAMPRLSRVVGVFSIALSALAAVCLLGLSLVDALLPTLGAGVWVAATVLGLVLIIDGARRRVQMAWPIALLAVLAVIAAFVTEVVMRGRWLDPVWLRYAYQMALVASAAVLAVGLISRISEYRNQRDRDQLARADSERRMRREAARADLNTALQGKLRSLAPGDVEWAAFRLLLDHLVPHVPVEFASVMVYGYQGQDIRVVMPQAHKGTVDEIVERRLLPLKRHAGNGMPLQQPVTVATEQSVVAMEAVIPLSIRAPAWGVLLLHRTGGDGFSTDELALAGEFSRLTLLHIEQALAAINLRRSAELDALTGAFNRRTIDQWLVRSFADADRDRLPISVLFVDMDHFKSINDRYGHACGDQCLREVAATLRGALSEGDLLGRYGGEEFIAVLPGREGAAARVVGEQLRAAIERLQFEWEGQPIRLTVSVGVATRLQSEEKPAATVDRADKALYAAKRGGRNCVHVAPAVFS
jgi:diguanylate cyclase (GGDEF)-like protein